MHVRRMYGTHLKRAPAICHKQPNRSAKPQTHTKCRRRDSAQHTHTHIRNTQHDQQPQHKTYPLDWRPFRLANVEPGLTFCQFYALYGIIYDVQWLSQPPRIGLSCARRTWAQTLGPWSSTRTPAHSRACWYVRRFEIDWSCIVNGMVIFA